MSATHGITAADYFGGRVAIYDSRYDRLDADGHALRARLTAVRKLVGAGPGRALDVGIGPGRLCVELAGDGWTVSGVDASAAMVEVARRRLPEARERLVCAPVESLPFPPGSFDVVTATGVLEYAAVDAALREICRVLRPGGRAVVSYPNPHAVYGLWKTRLWYPLVRGTKRVLRLPHPEMPHGAGELTPRAFAVSLGRAGLQPRAVVHASYLPVVTPLDMLFPRSTARLGRRLEGSGSRLSVLAATQIVYEAVKPPTGKESG